MVSSFNHLSSHPVGLYSLSALAVVLLSKKDGVLALSSTVLLVVSCVWRAMLNGQRSDFSDATQKMKAQRSRPRLRADAESFVPKQSRDLPKPKPSHNLHVQQYRHLLTAADDSSTDDSPRQSLLLSSTDATPRQSKNLLIAAKPEQKEKTPPWRKTAATEAAPRSRSVTPPPGLPEPSFAPPPGLPEPSKITRAVEQAAEARSLLARLVDLEKDTPAALTHDGRLRKPAGKRIVAGVRESTRAIANDRAAAILVATDLHWTEDGKLEEPKMQKMIEEAQAKGVAVVVSLSRAELGDAISKDVSSAVLALLDVSGAEDVFQRFLQASSTTPAPAA